MEQIAVHAAAQRYEEAAALRDDATRLRNAIVNHRRTESLRGTGRLLLEICGEGTVELHDGLFLGDGAMTPESLALDSTVPESRLPGSYRLRVGDPQAAEAGETGSESPDRGATDEDQDRAVAAQWLDVHAELVRVVHSERPFFWPAEQIPELTDMAHPRSDRDGPAGPETQRGLPETDRPTGDRKSAA
ncbi:MAG TPA: hypothetical protein VHY77_11525 [Acidimicrobiales bacterium]|nr:hypothetical protein [Acidimicrobiales bacterium]